MRPCPLNGVGTMRNDFNQPFVSWQKQAASAAALIRPHPHAPHSGCQAAAGPPLPLLPMALAGAVCGGMGG